MVSAPTRPATWARVGVTCQVSERRPDSARRTDAYSTAADATPSRAWGSRMLHEESPKIRTDSAISHNEPGALSTVIELAESREPDKKAFHETEPACTAAE